LLELNALDKPIITVLNKIDKMEDKHWLEDLKKNYHNGINISAATGENVQELLDLITKMLPSQVREIDVHIPLNRMDLVNLAHKEGEVLSVKYFPDSINIRATIPNHLVGKFDVKH
jgi:GTPase